MASSPDNDRTGRHCQTARARQARWKGVREKPTSKLLKSKYRLQPGGCGPDSSARPFVGDSETGLRPPVGRPRGTPAAYPWRGCRSTVGHRPRQTVHGERGNHLRAPKPAGQPDRRREGPPSTDGVDVGRGPRSSPRTGKPATWRRGTAGSAATVKEDQETLVNIDEPWPSLDEAEARVLKVQTKLHQWAADDPYPSVR